MSPAALVALARAKKIRVLALVDHDTVAGLSEFYDAAARSDGAVTAIGGIEISALGCGAGAGAHVHVLGYGVPAHVSESFARTLADFQAARDSRGGAILEKLRSLGFDISLDEVRVTAQGEVFGRPHIADAMIRRGFVRDKLHAFEEYLGQGAKAYVERDRPTAIEAVRALRGEGFVPVLAHPPHMRLPEPLLDRFIQELRGAGLLGLETHYSTYTSDETALCQRLAARFGLLSTGGSDFHGDSKPDITLGVGRGHLRVPDALAGKLLDAIARIRDKP